MFVGKARVLYYHIIADKYPDIYAQGISPKRMELQILGLKRLGYQFVPLSKSVMGGAGPRRVSLCTDDGFACNYSGLLPLMQKFKLKPCLFLVGKCVDNMALAWNHKLMLLKRLVPESLLHEHLSDLLSDVDIHTLFAKISMESKEQVTDELWQRCMLYSQEDYLQREQPYLTTAQLQVLLENGAELALHSHTHPDFSRLNLAAAEIELQANMETLEQRNLPYHKLFAYPYGRAMNPADEACLIQKLKLQATFGIRYTAGQNTKPFTRWQRQSLEANAFANFLEFAAKPLYRKFLSK